MFYLIGLNSLTFCALFLTFLVVLYYYLTRNYNYWTSRGINGPKPIALFGTLHYGFSKSFQELNLINTKKYGKIYGTFFGTRPILVVAEPELIKNMNIKDFHIFVDRTDITIGNPIDDRSLFNLFGDEWKKMRSIISPTFSSGKMRRMHPLIEKCVERLETVLTKKANDSNNEIELKKLMGNLTMDVIASCAFGTQIDTHNEPNNQFIKYAEMVFSGNWRIWVFFILKTTLPKILDLTQFQATDPNVANFFRSAIRAILSKRKSESADNKHNDFLQLMINANKKTDNIEKEEFVNNEALYGQLDETEIIDSKSKSEITEDDIIATAFLFFIAGYETTSSLLSFLFYSLALDQECQQKLYEEVLSYNGEFDYESIAKMSYLDACIAETLRLYNPLPMTDRMAAEDYKLGDTGITIPKGMIVQSDIQSIHRNPEYYPNPEKWDPERFMPENRDKLIPYTYLPFGLGPRNCVGMRFALMEAKTAVVHLINKFKFVRSQNTQIPLKFKKFEFLLRVGDINVGIVHRK